MILILWSFQDNPPLMLLTQYLCGIPANVALTTNYAIYFTTSVEYRKALKKQLAAIVPVLGKRVKVSQSSVVSSRSSAAKY